MLTMTFFTTAFIFVLFTLTRVIFLEASNEAEQQQQQQNGVDGSSSSLTLSRQNVTIVAYNVNHLHYVFQVAFRPRNEGARIERLNDALKGIGKTTDTAEFGVPDVMVLTEVMSNRASQKVSELEDFPYQTPRLGNDCGDSKFDTMIGCKQILLNGGVKILSKFPILSTDGLVFSHRMNGDQLVNKGALRVRLRAPESGVVFNVIGTHMQSTDTAYQKCNMEEKEVRKRQIREILDWIRSLKISEDEAVFIAGDFNVEFGSPEYARFLEDVPLEIDYQKDEQIGGSFSAKFRGDKTNWLTAYHLYGSNVSQIDETLDFIAVVTDRSQPIQKTSMKVVPLKSAESWKWWRMGGNWIINGTVYYHSGYYRDLSDHYPVIQSFLLEAVPMAALPSKEELNPRPF